MTLLTPANHPDLPLATSPIPGPRLAGLDLARSFALMAMVMVNFRLAMGVSDAQGSLLQGLFEAIQGRSAACFVILAGIGLQLGIQQLTIDQARHRLWRRAAFLMLAGLLNLMVFPADILHYYASFFFIATFLFYRSTRTLLAFIALSIFLAISLHFILDYRTGWNFQELSYASFATVNGAVFDFPRHLFFNGWHPVFPWLAFLLWGMCLARLPLHHTRIQAHLFFIGAVVTLICFIVAQFGRAFLPQWHDLFSLQPMPALPLYVIAASASASMVVGACLWIAGIANKREKLKTIIDWLTPVGRMSLSLYIAHILIGMGVLESIGWLQGRSLMDVVIASMTYFGCALLFCRLWTRFFKQGPLESLMRTISRD